MNVLVFNAGSNSLRFGILDTGAGRAWAGEGHALVGAMIEGIGGEATLKEFGPGGEVTGGEKLAARDYGDATNKALAWLEKRAERGSPRPGDADAVGHRIVHGADRFEGPATVDDEVLATIEGFEELAPLHNKPAVDILRAAREALAAPPHVAVFDTSFHRSLPERAYTYALPAELAARHKIRRYGFHGTSHRYLTNAYARLVGRAPETCTIITLHLEGGCSAAAIAKGRSVDTSMGFTPLEGLVMGTRSGDIDPAIVAYLARKEGLDLADVEKLLNKRSGLLGISGLSGDTRVLEPAAEGDRRAALALEVFAYRVRKYIGAYLAALGGAEAVVFGGGIGQDAPHVRASVCEGLECFGLTLDPARNADTVDVDGRISVDGASLAAYVVVTDEAKQIAYEVAGHLAR